MKHKNVDMLNGSITKGLISMTIPIMIMHVMTNLFSVIDMTVLGRYADDTAVGAVGACGTLIALCNGLLIGCSAGSNIIVARHIGERDLQRTNDAVNTAILFSVLGGLTLTVIGVSCAEIFLKWTNCPKEILPLAVKYFRLYFTGSPALMVYTFGASILRASGDTKRPMYFTIIGGLSKIALNFFCVKVLHTTVEGVAIATILSNLISGSLSLITIRRMTEKIHFRFRELKIKIAELKEILFLGIPSGMQQAMYSFANVIIATTVNSFGAAATTGISIANQFDGILYQIACAPAYATIPYVAQNLGAGQIERAKKSVYSSVFITVAFGASFGFLSAFFSAELSSIMSKTPEVIAYSRQKMIIISSTYFICGINEIMGGALKGMGKPFVPTISTLIFMCALRFVWVYLIFPFVPTLTFLYLVWPVGWTLSIITELVFYIPAMRKLKRKALSA
ncbi:MAG: MATE family efflux transporter [Clostridia bacterium]|nr:MATE family efflux transporter [Clostridia bacterium]